MVTGTNDHKTLVLFMLYIWCNTSCVTDLHSELPQGANRDTGDWAVVVGRDDGALRGSANTGHSLEGEKKLYLKTLVFNTKNSIVASCLQGHRACNP